MKNRNNLQSGFSIVEILVSLGLMGIAMAAMITMISNQNSAIKQMESKLAILDLERYMITSLSGSAVCTFALTYPTPQKFNSEIASSSIPSISKIYSSANASSPLIVSVGSAVSPAVTIQSISVKEINSLGNADEFQGYLEIAFHNSSGMAFKPLRFLINLKTNSTSPANGKEVVSCNTPTPSAAGGSGIQVFTTSGFFVVPSGVKTISVIVQGSGGGGGTQNGSGGGGGGVATGKINVTPGTQLAVQIGNGGTGATFQPFAAGVEATDGGTTSVGGISCAGGKKGNSHSYSGGAGGTCSGGDTTTAGEDGKSGSSKAGAGGAGQGLGGGAGGAEIPVGPCKNGFAGNVYGGGGGGGGYISGCTEVSGGSGAPGRVIIEW